MNATSTNAVLQAFARRMHELCDDLGIPSGRGRQTDLARLVGLNPNAARTMVRARAIALKRLGPRQVMEALVASADRVVPYNTADLTITSADGKRVARIIHGADGKTAVVFGKGAVADARREELRQLIASFLG